MLNNKPPIENEQNANRQNFDQRNIKNSPDYPSQNVVPDHQPQYVVAKESSNGVAPRPAEAEMVNVEDEYRMAQRYPASYPPAHQPVPMAPSSVGGAPPQGQRPNSSAPSNIPPNGSVIGPHTPSGPSRPDVIELANMIMQESKSILQSNQLFRTERDEIEMKLRNELTEVALMQRALYDLDCTFNHIKKVMLEEVAHLRKELDIARSDKTSPITSLLPDFLNDEISQLFPNLPPVAAIVAGATQTANAASHLNGASSIPAGTEKHADHSQPPAASAQATASALPKPTAAVLENFQSVTGRWDVDVDAVSSNFKTVGDDWSVIYNPEASLAPYGKLSIDLLHTLPHKSVICCLKFSPDGEFLVTGSNREASLFNATTGELLYVLRDDLGESKEDAYMRAIVFSPDGKQIAAASEDLVIRIWDTETRAVVHRLRGHKQDIYSLNWSKDGRRLLSGSGDASLRLWDVQTGECVGAFIKVQNRDDILKSSLCPVDSFKPSPDEVASEAGITNVSVHPKYPDCVVVGSLDPRITVWDLKTGNLVQVMEGHADSVYSISCSPCGRYVVSGSLDGVVKMWLFEPSTHAYFQQGSGVPPKPFLTTQALNTFVGHSSFVLSVNVAHALFTTNSGEQIDCILSGSKDKSVILWDANINAASKNVSDKPQLKLFGHQNTVITIDIHDKTATFATGSGDQRVRIWSMKIEPLKPSAPLRGN